MTEIHTRAEVYVGEPCKHEEHHDADGKTVRLISNNRCLLCYRAQRRRQYRRQTQHEPEYLTFTIIGVSI